MKIFAQHGYGPKDKLEIGLKDGIIDGVIFSPRYWGPERMKLEVAKYKEHGRFLAMDPEFYASSFISHPSPNLGSLEDWDYFQRPKKADLMTGNAIPGLLESSFDAQLETGFTNLIAPSVYIEHADSVDTAISVNFLNRAKEIASEKGDYPVYGTLAFHRDALLDGKAFRELMDSLTGLSNSPDGYYLIIGSNEQASTGRYIRSDLSQSEVIASWMYANYVLSINGMEVINGYSFLLGPLLGACGAAAAANGWSSGLRKYCQGKYVKTSGGGSAPNSRYVCNPLMAHILQTDLDSFKAIEPSVVNGLPIDEVYENGEPSRTMEGLQSWEALKAQSDATSFEGGDVGEQLGGFSEKVTESIKLWEQLRSRGLANEAEQNVERLKAIRNGIILFREMAEIP